MFPIHIELPFGTQYFYEGFYFFISFLCAIIYAKYRVKKLNFPAEHFDTVILMAILGAIIGGRLSHFVFWDTRLLLRDPLSLLKVWQGGISVTGGVAGGIFTAWIITKKKHIDFPLLIAVTSPAILLGQAIGRVGCFLNGDAFGLPSSLPWAVKFPRFGHLIPSFELDRVYSGFAWLWSYQRGLIDSTSEWSVSMHPTQLYESLGDLVLMFVLLYIIAFLYKKGKPLGSVIFLYAGGYSLLRFLIEFIRADRTGIIKPLNVSYLQLVLLAVFIVSAIMTLAYWYKHYSKKKGM